MSLYHLLNRLINEYTKNFTGLPKKCWLGIFLIFADAIAGGVCFFLSLYFVNDLNFSVKASGLLISSYGLGTVVGGMLGGKLTDRISANLTSQLGLILESISYLLLITLHSVATLLIDLFIMGVAAYVFKTGINCWVLSQPGMNSELSLKTLNLARIASNLGLAISGGIIWSFASSFRFIFIIAGCIFFISTLMLRINAQQSLIQYKVNPTTHLIATNNKILSIVLLFVFLIALIIAQLGSTYPLYIQESFTLGTKAVSILFILDTILIVMCQAPLVNALKESNKIFFIGLGGLFMGLGMLLLNFSSVFPLAIFSCIIWTTGEMLFVPLTQLFCYERSAKKVGKTMGAYQAIYALGAICGPTLGGMTYQYLGGRVIWYASGFIGVCCFLVCNYFKTYD